MGTPFIRIVRTPYEEPHLTRLTFAVSNGRVSGQLQIYAGVQELIEWAQRLEGFPQHARAVWLWQYGSERPEDRLLCYFRMRVFMVDPKGHSALQFRFNNNADLPAREISEFCIECDPAAINRLGKLFRAFAELKHEVLEWTLTSDALFDSPADPEQQFG